MGEGAAQKHQRGSRSTIMATCAKPSRWLAAAAALGAVLLACHLTWQPPSSGSSRLHAITSGSGSPDATWRLAASAAARGRCSDEARLAAAVDALLASPLPPRNTNISLEAPLVYIHQRKAAGSSVRQAVVEGARGAGLPLFAACRHGVRCDTFTLAGAPPSAVYAGHFPWAELRHLSRAAPGWAAGRATGWRRSPRLGASCLTNFRDPLARLESCFYYKQAAALKARAKVGAAPPADAPRPACLSDLGEAELLEALTAGGEHSCANEALRMLSGLGDVQDTAGLAALPTRVAVLELALAHLAQCVPLLVELPGTLALARHWFPQLAPAFGAPRQRNAGTAPRCPLSAAAAAAMRRLAAEEQLVYDAALARARAMLAALPPQAAAEAAALEAAGVAAAGASDDDDSEEEEEAGSSSINPV